MLIAMPKDVKASELGFRASTTAIDSLPAVFQIGQNEDAYESLVSTCSNPLLTVCNDSMDLAYRTWMLMLNDICLLYTSPSPRDGLLSRMPSSA